MAPLPSPKHRYRKRKERGPLIPLTLDGQRHHCYRLCRYQRFMAHCQVSLSTLAPCLPACLFCLSACLSACLVCQPVYLLVLLSRPVFLPASICLSRRFTDIQDIQDIHCNLEKNKVSFKILKHICLPMVTYILAECCRVAGPIAGYPQCWQSL